MDILARNLPRKPVRKNSQKRKVKMVFLQRTQGKEEKGDPKCFLQQTCQPGGTRLAVPCQIGNPDKGTIRGNGSKEGGDISREEGERKTEFKKRDASS